MTTILSIDGSADFSAPQTDALGLPLPQPESAATTLSAANDLPVANDLPGRSVPAAYESLIREPLRENAVLGAALQAIVDRLEPSVKAPVVDALKGAGEGVPSLSGQWESGQRGTRDAIVPELVVARNLRGDAPVVDDRGGVVRVASDVEVVSCRETGAPPRELGRAGVPSPAADGGGTPSLPDFETPSTVTETVVVTGAGVSDVAEKADGEGAKVVSEEPEAPTVMPFVPVEAQVSGVREVADSAEIAPVAAVSQVAETSRASAVLVEVAAEVAEALLVTPGLLSGQGEVRVQLKPDVLSGTEVKIAVTGREMSVEFSPVVHETAVFIEHNLPQLTQVLASRISVFNVNVSVRSGMDRDRSRA